MTPEHHDTTAVVIQRTIDANVELVWAMWTDPAHFVQWYGPPGSEISIKAFDVRPGGNRIIGMAMPTPDGKREMWFAGTHLTVEAPVRLAYTEFMADADGEPLDGAETAHSVTEVRVELREIGTQTDLKLTHFGIPPESPGAMGWQMSIDKLVTYLQGSPAIN